MALLKVLVLWAEMIGGCVADYDVVLGLNLNIDASEPSAAAQYEVTMRAEVSLRVSADTLTCLSTGLADLGW